MAKPTEQARAFSLSKPKKKLNTSAKSKRKTQTVRDDDKNSAKVRNRIEEIMEQRELNKEFDL